MSEIIHWGSNKSDSSAKSYQPHPSNILVEIGARHFCSSPKYRIALTDEGKLFNINDDGSGNFSVEV